MFGQPLVERTNSSRSPERRYEIKIEAHLDDLWADRFSGWTMEQQADGSTLLIGTAGDQAALHGALLQIRNLNLPLLSVQRIEGRPWPSP